MVDGQQDSEDRHEENHHILLNPPNPFIHHLKQNYLIWVHLEADANLWRNKNIKNQLKNRFLKFFLLCFWDCSSFGLNISDNSLIKFFTSKNLKLFSVRFLLFKGFRTVSFLSFNFFSWMGSWSAMLTMNFYSENSAKKEEKLLIKL